MESRSGNFEKKIKLRKLRTSLAALAYLAYSASLAALAALTASLSFFLFLTSILHLLSTSASLFFSTPAPSTSEVSSVRRPCFCASRKQVINDFIGVSSCVNKSVGGSGGSGSGSGSGGGNEDSGVTEK